MTNYEIADLAASLMSNFYATFTIFITIVTAYVVTAFVAGGRLTKIQLLIVNSCFLASAILIGFLSIATFGRASALIRTDPGEIPTYILPFDIRWLILTLYVGLLIGSFAFMTSIRRNKSATET